MSIHPMPRRCSSTVAESARATYLRLRGEGWSPKSARALSQREHPDSNIAADCRVVLLERQLAALRRELEAVRTAYDNAVSQSEHEAINAATAVAALSAKLEAERKRGDQAEALGRAAAQEFATLKATATELARLLSEARKEIEMLRSRTGPGTDCAHAEVGLHSSAPDFLVRAARTAFRKRYHPDTKPAAEKLAAEAAFKRFETAFSKLFRMRSMPV